MTTIRTADIDTPDWAMSLAGPGQIVQDGDDISQCISIIIRTQKGSDPLRPTFGADIDRFVDLPVNDAIPAIKRNIIDQVDRWEPRAEIVRVEHELKESQIILSIAWRDRRTGNENETQLVI